MLHMQPRAFSPATTTGRTQQPAYSLRHHALSKRSRTTPLRVTREILEAREGSCVLVGGVPTPKQPSHHVHGDHHHQVLGSERRHSPEGLSHSGAGVRLGGRHRRHKRPPEHVGVSKWSLRGGVPQGGSARCSLTVASQRGCVMYIHTLYHQRSRAPAGCVCERTDRACAGSWILGGFGFGFAWWCWCDIGLPLAHSNFAFYPFARPPPPPAHAPSHSHNSPTQPPPRPPPPHASASPSARPRRP